MTHRVLMTADTVGGVWTYAMELARVLCGQGASVALATMGASPSAHQRREAAEIPRLELFESEYKLEWMNDPWEDVGAAGTWLLALEREWGPDVVHLNGYCHGALPFAAPVLVAGHSCVLSWWKAVHGVQAPAEWDRYRHAVAAGLHAAGLVVTPSRAMLQALDEHYGPLRRTAVVPDGRSQQGYAVLAKQPFVFAAGRLWDHAKNIAAIDEAAAHLSWPVYVAGSTRHPDGTEARFRHARVLGQLTPRSMAWWLGRASIYALPARYEPFGLSILEAALAGCALVIGDLPSLRETWNETAVYVPPDDPAALASAIESVIQDPVRRISLANCAHARALELTPERMAASYLPLYNTLVRI